MSEEIRTRTPAQPVLESLAEGRPNPPQIPIGGGSGLPVTPIYPPDPDEINLLEYAYVLVKSKHWIILLTVLGMAAGFIAAKVKGPSYISEAVISPKESESQKTPSFSGFGALGGLMASQLNFAGSASLDKMKTILDSRRFNAELISERGLLPAIYQYESPKTYREVFDTTRQAWREDFVEPDPLSVGGSLKTYLKKEIKDNLMNLKVTARDSAFAHGLMTNYLSYLDDFLRTSVRVEARENVRYLDSQLIIIADPLLRAKLQDLIANEVEKEMVVSKEAFRIIDPPFTYRKFKEKKLYPLVFGFGLFFLSVLWAVFAHAFSSGTKTEEDSRLIEGIRRELRKLW